MALKNPNRQLMHQKPQSCRGETRRLNFQVLLYLIPEDGVVFIAAHRQSVTLEAQVH